MQGSVAEVDTYADTPTWILPDYCVDVGEEGQLNSELVACKPFVGQRQASVCVCFMMKLGTICQKKGRRSKNQMKNCQGQV
jgi:hypothetical protein